MTCPEPWTKTRTSISRKNGLREVGISNPCTVEQFSSQRQIKARGTHTPNVWSAFPAHSWENCRAAPSQQSTSASQQAWRMRKRYHLLFHPGSKGFLRCGFTRSLNQQLCQAGGPNKGEKAVCGCTAPGIFARWHLGKAITSIFSVIVIWVYFCYRFSQRCARC